MLKKCKWFNNAVSPIVLTIDDLSYGYINYNSKGKIIKPQYDWGYNCRNKNSIFKYLEDRFVIDYPFVKYTIFVPFGKHSLGMVKMRYDHYCGDIFENNEFLDLLCYINNNGNEVAYHGHNHGYAVPSPNKKTWVNEQDQYTSEDYANIIFNDIIKLKSCTGIEIKGGRSPGYKSQRMLEIVKLCKFIYWSFDYRNNVYDYKIVGDRKREGIIRFPTCFSGSELKILNMPRGILNLRNLVYLKNFYKKVLKAIETGSIINVTEHFLRTRPDGKIQTPNIFDDINSLKYFFNILKSYNLWYATCIEISNYINSYVSCKIQYLGSNKYKVSFGNSNFVSFISSKEKIFCETNSKEILCEKEYMQKGIYIYNNLKSGIYRI